MKRFAVFSGETYEPNGGWGDFLDAFDTFEEALVVARQQGSGIGEWSEVVDLEALKVVYASTSGKRVGVEKQGERYINEWLDEKFSGKESTCPILT